MPVLSDDVIRALAAVMNRTPREVEARVVEAGNDTRRILEHLQVHGGLDPARTPAARAVLAGIQLWNPDQLPLDRLITEQFDENDVSRLGAVPVARQDGEYAVAMVDPLDLDALDQIEERLGAPVRPLLAQDIQTLLQAYRNRPAPVSAGSTDGSGVLSPTGDQETTSNPGRAPDEIPLPDDVDLNPAIEIDPTVFKSFVENSGNRPFEGDYAVMQVVEVLLTAAVQREASDIHIDPDEQALRVRMRINGVLEDVMDLDARMGAPVTARIKIMADMDMSEKRMPQDGYLSHHKFDGGRMDVRVSTCPTIHGEKVVLRILRDSANALTLDTLDLTPRVLGFLRQVAHAPHGMVIVAGPTGSGKTTTLYGLLHEVNAVTENILTVEDPVEIRVSRFNQVQVNNKAGRTFAGTLRSFLRQDPDVILVGETRDQETAQIGMQAALTGHLVLTTLHANSVTQIPARLTDLGVPRHLISTALIGGIGQRLVRRLCSACKEPEPAGGPTTSALGIAKLPPGIQVFRARGCAACGDTGYAGRLAVVEALAIDDHVRRLIHEGAAAQEIRHALHQVGLLNLRMEALRRVLKGQTSLDEVRRVTMQDE
jgi:type II secretory ATPase GspE/PulE/Tfp pilus assembly ATPase PilB-like protein